MTDRAAFRLSVNGKQVRERVDFCGITSREVQDRWLCAFGFAVILQHRWKGRLTYMSYIMVFITGKIELLRPRRLPRIGFS